LEQGSFAMKIRILLLISILFLNPLLSHPSEKDRAIKVFFHCGKNAITKMNEEGRGGLGSLLSWVETEKQNHEKKNGRAYLLFPFIDAKDKFLNSFPYDGYQKDKMNALEIGSVKLGLGFLSSFQESEELYDKDAFIYFVSENGENKKGIVKLPNDPQLPFFLLTEPDTKASFTYLANVHEIHCPVDFGKLGVLDLYFRNRDLIRIHHEILSINLWDRNRSWKPKHPNVDETELPISQAKKKDRSSLERKSDTPYVGLGNSIDREILNTEKGSDKISVGQVP
jgi:hypothetical protein